MIIQCKMCGGDLNLTNGSSIAKCEYCGTVQTVPVAGSDANEKINLFDRANGLRFSCEFDKASTIYESIIAKYPEEAEAYWGALLCKYGIEYVDDPATGNKIPTCHRLSFDRVPNDAYYTKAYELADDDAKAIYEDEAKKIESIRNKIIAASNKEDPYDVFICYKESDDNGDRTEDSVIAERIYNELMSKNYRVFFSKITLEDKLGEEYEPLIFAALNSAKVMLVVGTSIANFNAVWVRNEWSRYLDIMKNTGDRVLIPCYKGIDPYDLPKEFAGLQAQDMGKVGAVEDITRGITKVIPKGTQKVGITEDALKTILKKESKNRTIKNTVVFVLIAVAVAIGGYFGIKALITLIKNLRTQQVIVREVEEEEEDATVPDRETPTPTLTPIPTPIPTPETVDWTLGEAFFNTDANDLSNSYSTFDYGITTLAFHLPIEAGPRNEELIYYTEWFDPNGSCGYDPVAFDYPCYPGDVIGSCYYFLDGSLLERGEYTCYCYQYGTDRLLGSATATIQ